MEKTEKYEVELQPDEYQAMIRNRMIASMCDDLLASPRKRSGYLMLHLALPSNKMKLVQAWLEIHRDELMADWELAASGQQPYKIEPLK